MMSSIGGIISLMLGLDALQIVGQKVLFFGYIFSNDQFPIKFPIIALRALRQGKGRIKNGF